MAEQEANKKLEAETVVTETPVPAEAKSDVEHEKSTVPPPEVKHDDSKALAVVEKVEEPDSNRPSMGSHDREVALAELEKEKQSSFIKAWEDGEKSKADNKAQKKLSAVAAWENSKKAALEAKLKKFEEQLEKQKAEYAEKMKNKAASIQKLAEEKRAIVEAQRGEELLKADEVASKFRATGKTPKKFIGCF